MSTKLDSYNCSLAMSGVKNVTCSPSSSQVVLITRLHLLFTTGMLTSHFTSVKEMPVIFRCVCVSDLHAINVHSFFSPGLKYL